MIYGLEPLSDIRDELEPLIKKVWDEVDSRAKFLDQEVDMNFYLEAEAAGMCRVYTIRDKGNLIGFSVNMIQPIPHCKGKFCSVIDGIYIEPEYRGIGKDFINIIDEDLKDIGVTYSVFALKEWDEKENLVEALGYKHYESMYRKVL